MATSPENVFDRLLREAVAAGKIPVYSEEARKWFMTKATKENKVGDIVNKMAQSMRSRNVTMIGRCYIFKYDPKLKKELPYYDTLPIVFPISMKRDGFLGINLHYLPPMMRAKLMDALYATASNKKFDATTKAKISYRILKSASRYRFFKPCVKRYLNQHIKSRFIEVYSAEWSIGVFLPIAQFKKATERRVWKDSQISVR